MASFVDTKCTIFDSAAVNRVRDELRFEPGLLRHLRTRFIKNSLDVMEALQALPADMAPAFADRVRFSELTLDRRFDSEVDGASRLVFKTTAGFAIESIILRAGTGRVALCISSQVGCAAACDFCATGKMGIARNLTHAEILDQIAQANRLLRDEGRRVRNIVFMGMGEPLHNEAEVHTALDGLLSAEMFHHPGSRILLSTVGVTDALLRCAEAFPGVNYALSLHSADQPTRARLMPLARANPLDRLRDAVRQLNRLQSPRRAVMIEYLMLRGVNDSPEQIDQLIEWIQGLRVHVNLIPFNPIDEASHLSCSPRYAIEAAGERIRSTGVPTTIRYSMGADIAAACGQLVQRENRRIARLIHTAPLSTPEISNRET